MSGIALSRRARDDLAGIWAYTNVQWSATQADRYLRLIWSVIVAVARRPDRGRSCDGIREGYMRIPAGSHMIFHRQERGRIHIIRVLHQGMDYERHL